jgi:hypothetical protein
VINLLGPLTSGATYAASVAARAAYRLHAIVYAALLLCQWITEDVTRICGFDALVFLLVALALLCLNALSLLYIAAAGLGMFRRAWAERALPRLLPPVLSIVLVSQYVCLTLKLRGGSHAPVHAVYAWLGCEPTRLSVAVVFVVFCSAVLCMQSRSWQRSACSATCRQASSTAPEAESDAVAPLMPGGGEQWSASQDSRSGSASGAAPDTPPAHQLYRLIHSLPSLRHSSFIRLDGQGASLQSASSAHGGGAPFASMPGGAPALHLVCSERRGVARTMPVHSRTRWGWPDHLRFWSLRFSLDLLMIFVVALCCAQRDLIHAAYLSLTLFLFRRREALRLRGNALFLWLPLATYCVIAALLLFQAPVSMPWRAAQDGGGGGGERCTFAHLLGLHRIAGAGHARVFFVERGAGLPLLMWLAMQVRSLLSCCLGQAACTHRRSSERAGNWLWDASLASVSSSARAHSSRRAAAWAVK